MFYFYYLKSYFIKQNLSIFATNINFVSLMLIFVQN